MPDDPKFAMNTARQPGNGASIRTSGTSPAAPFGVTGGLLNPATFPAAADGDPVSKINVDVRPLDFWSPYVRRSDHYQQMQGKLDQLGYSDTHYFGAVSKMTANLANTDNRPFGGLAGLSDPVRRFGESLSQGIADFNDGQLSKIVSGKIADKGKALDSRLIADEQDFIEGKLDGLKKTNPSLYQEFITGINANANRKGLVGWLDHVTDPEIAQAADNTRKYWAGRSISRTGPTESQLVSRWSPESVAPSVRPGISGIMPILAPFRHIGYNIYGRNRRRTPKNTRPQSFWGNVSSKDL